MKWYDLSDTSRPVISPAVEVDNFLKKHKSIEKFGMSDSLIMLLTGEEPSYLKEEYADSIYENEFLLPAFIRKYPIYNIRGGNPISLIGKALSAPVALDALETAIAFGCKRVFLFGLCGGISQDLNIGDMIVPTEIIREEGTSYHYMQSNLNAEPDKELLGQLIIS